jgi:hypothetical protein
VGDAESDRRAAAVAPRIEPAVAVRDDSGDALLILIVWLVRKASYAVFSIGLGAARARPA